MSSNKKASAKQLPAPLRSQERQLDPFDWYATMRREAPVHYDDQRNVWDVFRYDDIDRILRDQETFSSDPRRADTSRSNDDADRPFLQTMIVSDPPDHERLRGFTADRFHPGTIREFQPRIKAAVDDVLNAIADADRIDIVDDVAYPIPVTVIAELLGIPSERRDQFKAWSNTFAARPKENTEAAIEETQTQRRRAEREMGEYFSELLDKRANGGGDDLITLAATTDDLSRNEKIGFCILLLIAGNVTTTALITNAIWCFDEQNMIDAVRGGEIDRKQALEEVLRYRSPVQYLRRGATEAVEIGGKQIDAGETITLWIGSANRDPDVFEAPAEFWPERRPNPHIAFGKGIHFCLGAPLARLEADIAIEAVLEQFEVLVPDDSKKIPFQNGLAELPCRVKSER